MGGNAVEFAGGAAVADHPTKHVEAPPAAYAVRVCPDVAEEAPVARPPLLGVPPHVQRRVRLRREEAH
eukprot:9920906-Lingulodinium_polyedra.AAC.1